MMIAGSQSQAAARTRVPARERETIHFQNLDLGVGPPMGWPAVAPTINLNFV
jgi:hypothetical protein